MDALRSGGSRRGILRAAALVPAAAVLAAGCTGTGSGLYSWGRYEDSVYDLYVRADSFDTADEIRRLGEDVDRAVSRGRRVPPGVRAHLGYLSLLAGDDRGAEAWLRAEKEAFPESAVFIDGILRRMAQ